MTRHLASVGLGPGTVFLTVTAPGRVFSAPDWNRTAPRRFAALMRDIRTAIDGARAGGGVDAVEYARVLELQARGVLHVHALVTGWARLDMERVRLLCIRHGFGPWFQVEPIRDMSKAAGYVAARYLLKSHEDIGRGYRVVQYSRGWAGPWERATDDGRDARTWATALQVVDPTCAVVPDGMTWGEWADREIRNGRGEVLFDSGPSGWPSGRDVLTPHSGEWVAGWLTVRSPSRGLAEAP